MNEQIKMDDILKQDIVKLKAKAKKTQKDWEKIIKYDTKYNPCAAIRALIIVYCYTDPEKRYYGNDNPYKGFSREHKKDFTDIVIHLRSTGRMTTGQLKRVQNTIGRYWKQLLPIIKKQDSLPKGFNGLIECIGQYNDSRVLATYHGEVSRRISLISNEERKRKKELEED